MKTYNDLVAVGENEKERIDFIRQAINDHCSSERYKTAVDAEVYYDGLNPTINRYEKSFTICKAALTLICGLPITSWQAGFLAWR